MSFISKEEFQTHVYAEAQNAISRGNESRLIEAIETALQTVSRYLSNYDTTTIYTSTGTDKEKYREIILYAKDIAKWHFVNVCNVNVDLELAERRYTLAIKELERIQKGSIIAGWPLASSNPNPAPFRAGSNKKFNHYY